MQDLPCQGSSAAGIALRTIPLSLKGEKDTLGNMYEVRIESSFAAAHRLIHYHGKCERFHGHNYKVRLWARGESLGEGGMLVDFGLLKKALAEVLAGLDHRDLNELQVFRDDPSAERIAKYIFDGIAADHPEIPLSAVEVFETDSSMAKYSPSDISVQES